MSEVYCNDPTCKEHYCQVSGVRLKDDKPYPDKIEKLEVSIENLNAVFVKHERRIDELEKEAGKAIDCDLRLQKRIEELENQQKIIYQNINELHGKTSKKEEEYNLTFWEALEAMKEGYKVKSIHWNSEHDEEYISLKDADDHFRDENKLICTLSGEEIKDKWRIVRE